MDLSGIGGHLGESWPVYCCTVYSGPGANHRVVHLEHTYLLSMQRGGRGSNNHQFWWMQSFDLEKARALASAEGNVVSDGDEEEELVTP